MDTTTDRTTRTRHGALGTAALRPDGLPKVQGRFAFSSDAWADNMLWGATLRSPHPHARIRSIDVSAALAINGVAAVTTLFLAEEDTPAVRRCHWPAARLDGGLRLPRVFRQRRPNRGVEAVAADPDGRHVWAANEEALEPDGPPPTETTGTVVRLVRIPINPPAEPGRRAFQTGYAVAPPHRFTRLLDQTVYAGVVALVALGEGRLIVLERSGCPGLPPFANRVVLVETSGAPDVAALDGGLAATSGRLARTTTLWTGSIHANLEGLCLGPPVGEGRLLVGVTDDGGLPLPSGVMGFRLAYGDGAVGSDAEGGPNPVPSP